MSYKDEETRQEIQKYLNENSLLKQKIIELKGSLYWSGDKLILKIMELVTERANI